MKLAAKNGEKGEKLALDYLQNNAFQILYTNWRNKHAEIDIIAQKNNSIIFVEVKFRSATIYGNPESLLFKHKLKKMPIKNKIFVKKLYLPFCKMITW